MSAIRLVLAPPVAEIILNKPDKRNAMSVDMWAEIPGLIENAAAADDVKVVLIHGGDAGAFAAGADISEFSSVYGTREAAAASGAMITAALNAVEFCAKPVIAAIEGACVGAGVSLALAADLRVAAEDATFGVPPAKLGLVYPAGDTRRLVNQVGAGAAKDILFTGRLFGAEEAKSLGMVERLCAPGEALTAATALAEEISQRSQWSTRAIKQMIAGLSNGWREDGPEAQALFLEGFDNEDFREGSAAFLEKRRAKFTFG